MEKCILKNYTPSQVCGSERGFCVVAVAVSVLASERVAFFEASLGMCDSGTPAGLLQTASPWWEGACLTVGTDI